MLLSLEVLRESAAARQSELSYLSNDRAKEIILRVKPIHFARWSGIDFITVPQLAVFLSLSQEKIRNLFRTRFDEFRNDGIKRVRDTEAIAAHLARDSTNSRSPMIICPPLAILRTAMFLSGENSVCAEVVQTYIEEMLKSIRASNDLEEDLNKINNEPNSQIDLYQKIVGLEKNITIIQQQLSQTTQQLAKVILQSQEPQSPVYESTKKQKVNTLANLDDLYQEVPTTSKRNSYYNGSY